MKAEDKKVLAQPERRSPFWVCFGVFLLLACEHGAGLKNLLAQYQQLQQTRALQDQNLETLYQARQLGKEVEALSLDLISLASTNAAAKQIVQDFGIKWTPSAAAAAPAPTAPAPK